MAMMTDQARTTDRERLTSGPALFSAPIQWCIRLAAITVIVFAGLIAWQTDDPPHRAEIDSGAELRIDINQAGDQEFALMPGIGPVLARRIVEDRRLNGRFASLDDLTRVRGIGEKTVAAMKPFCNTHGGTNANDMDVLIAER
jgi:competence ComEA-like helix-hairpin-helix protein